MNLGWRCAQRCTFLMLLVLAIYVQYIVAFHSPSLSFPPATRMIRFGKARTATNQLMVSNSLVDDVFDVEVYNQPTIQRSKTSSVEEAIGIGLPNTSPGDRQVATSSRTKGIDWTYEMVRFLLFLFAHHVLIPSYCSLFLLGRRIILTTLAVQTEAPRY